MKHDVVPHDQLNFLSPNLSWLVATQHVYQDNFSLSIACFLAWD